MVEGTPNAVLIARYCKLFGIAPADEFGVIDPIMRMAINWACYVSYQHAENLAYEDAKDTKQSEVSAFGAHLDQLRELEEMSKSRGGL